MGDRVGDATTRVLIEVMRQGRHQPTLDTITAAVGQPRPTVYSALQRLRTRGLVEWSPGHQRTLRPAVHAVPFGDNRTPGPVRGARYPERNRAHRCADRAVFVGTLTAKLPQQPRDAWRCDQCGRRWTTVEGSGPGRR